MVKTTGPAFGTQALGALAKTLIFSKSKGKDTVKLYRAPAQPRSEPQIAMRAIHRFLSTTWSSLSQSHHDAWNNLAAAANYSPFNAFLTTNLARWRRFAYPIKTPDASGTYEGGTSPTYTLTQLGRGILFELSFASINKNWGATIIQISAGGVNPEWQRLKHALTIKDTAVHTWHWTPLQPGIHWFRLAAFDTLGNGLFPGHTRNITIT